MVDIEIGKKQTPVIIETDKKPTTFTFYFSQPVPRLFITVQNDKTDRYYYFRNCHKPVTELHIRMPITPQVCRVTFFTNSPFGIKSKLIGHCSKRRVDWSDPRLKPQVLRDYKLNDIKTVYCDLGYSHGSGTPARHFVSGPLRGLMEYDINAFNTLPVYTLEAIKRHELAHFFYDDEDLADLWMLYKMAEDGFGISQAENALVYVLNRTPENVQRIMKMYNAARDFEAKYFE